jgi:hypothetical protein
MNNRVACAYLLPGLVIGSAALGLAQGVPTMTIPTRLPTLGPGAAIVQKGGAGVGFQFVSGEPAIPAEATQPVKGAPYSLDATIEIAQTLSDGNRIVHRQTVHLYRDSKGRTRREETLAAIGPWAASGTPPTMITIQDPVSDISYFLDPRRKIATKLPTPQTRKAVMVTGGVVNGEEGSVPVTASVDSDAVSGGFVSAGDGRVAVVGFNAGPPGQILQPPEKSDPLGKETIIGLSSEGTRTTVTIPPNVVGNERPLDIIRERWYSSDLQIVLRSKQEDPRFGETTYEVTKLDRVDPASSLFEVPSHYKIKQGQPLTVQIRRNHSEQLAQRQVSPTISGATGRAVVDSGRPDTVHAVSTGSGGVAAKLGEAIHEDGGRRSPIPAVDEFSLNGGSSIVRVTLLLSSLVAMGIPVHPDIPDARVIADVMIGPFGAVMGIRLVEAKTRAN